MSWFPKKKKNSTEPNLNNFVQGGSYVSGGMSVDSAVNQPATNLNAGDSALPQKQRARRRLVGAAAFALLAVVVLPLLLDKQTHIETPDIKIEIPSKDTPFVAGQAVKPNATKANTKGSTPDANVTAPDAAKAPADSTMPENHARVQNGNESTPLPPVKPNTSASAAGGGDSKTTEVILPALAVAPTVPASSTQNSKLASKPTTQATTQPTQPITKPTAAQTSETNTVSVKPTTTIKSASTPQKPSSVSEAQRVQNVLEGKADAPMSKKFAVQVAALVTAEKVQELRKQLTAKGINSYTEKIIVKEGTVTRVRVGPFATREQAQAALKKINALHLGESIQATIVN